MRTYYAIDDIAYVELEATFREHVYNVMGIVVEAEYQQLGIGTALMKAVCKDADAQGIELWLVATPLGIPKDKLAAFYKGLGFSGDGSGYMIRKPSYLIRRPISS